MFEQGKNLFNGYIRRRWVLSVKRSRDRIGKGVGIVALTGVIKPMRMSIQL